MKQITDIRELKYGNVYVLDNGVDRSELTLRYYHENHLCFKDDWGMIKLKGTTDTQDAISMGYLWEVTE